MPHYCIELGCLCTARYNHPGEKPFFCKKHADFEGGMVNTRDKMCKNGCGKRAVINELCVKCARKNGWDKLAKKECKNGCGKQSRTGFDDFCRACFNETNGIPNYIIGERNIKLYLCKNFPNLLFKTSWSVIKYFVDFYIELSEVIIVLENDPNQHKNSRYKNETKRENEIFAELSKKKRTVLIRFNPDDFKVNGIKVEVPLEDKMEMLGEFIEHCIADETKSGIFRLFYDE